MLYSLCQHSPYLGHTCERVMYFIFTTNHASHHWYSQKSCQVFECPFLLLGLICTSRTFRRITITVSQQPSLQSSLGHFLCSFNPSDLPSQEGAHTPTDTKVWIPHVPQFTAYLQEYTYMWLLSICIVRRLGLRRCRGERSESCCSLTSSYDFSSLPPK